MTGQTIAYVRVRSAEQNHDRQEGITEGADRAFREKASAKTLDRPVLTELIAYARQGDIVRVWSVDRLALNLRDLDSIIQDLIPKGVTVQFAKENLTYSPDGDVTPMEHLMFQMLSVFAEFERSIINERRGEGMAAARGRGKTGGARPPALTPEQQAEVAARHAQGVPVARIAREARVHSRTTIYKASREAHRALEGRSN